MPNINGPLPNRSKLLAKRYSIYLLLALYVALGNIYGVITPIMEASDELWHYPMVKYIADHWQLPVQEPGVETPWRQEGSQAPLYYWLGAVLTSWIDTSDLAQVRWINPHADSGIIRPDGNGNLLIHSAAESFPWRGTTLAIHVLRFFSVWMGAGTVYLTYRLVLELWPKSTGFALTAAAVTAFNPMFCFISGSVNNGNLGMLLSAAGLWLLTRLVSRHGTSEPLSRSAWWADVSVLGLILGFAVLTRTNTIGLLPLTALSISYVAWRRREWWYFISGGLVTAGLVVLISGWWFVRNAILYDGDWTGIDRFMVILGYRDPPATLRQLWGERHGFMMAYWGLFGGVNVPMPEWVYTVLNGAVVASVIGLLVGLAKKLFHLRDQGVRLSLESIAKPSGLKPLHLQLLLLFLWPGIVVTLWALWATKTWSSQGRLVFGAISAWSTWMALGLGQFLPRRWSSVLPGAVGVFMLGTAAWAPWSVIAPAYRASVLPAGAEPAPEHVLRADVGGQLRLLGYDIEDTSAEPGEAFRFTLYWEAQQEMDRNWSVFCHVLDRETGLPTTTRDRYPGQGLLATSLMEPGLLWADRYVVQLPEMVYAPAEAVLEIGLYDVMNGERPPIIVEVGNDVEIVDNALRFQPLYVLPRPGELPNPVHVNLQDELALVGWDADRRVVAPGETVHLVLYWECLAPMDKTYKVSAQLLGEGERKAAQWDSRPGDLDTSTWHPGQRVEDRRELAVYADVPSGAYDLRIMVYDEETMKRMRIVDVQGRILPDDVLTLDHVRVSGSEQ
jgi:4-amino-4-deoxy-L-arabinose transferase-like glycosyltransferase